MTVSGDNFNNRKRECKLRETRICEKSRTSSGGIFYDYCRVRNAECKKKKCVFRSGGE